MKTFRRIGTFFVAMLIGFNCIDANSVIWANEKDIDFNPNIIYVDDNTKAEMLLKPKFDSSKFELLEVKNPKGINMDLSSLAWVTRENGEYVFTYEYLIKDTLESDKAVIKKQEGTYKIIIDKIISKDADHSIKREANSKIARKNTRATLLNEVFLNGRSGTDTNDGVTSAQAVKTFEKAKDLLAENGTIWINGEVEIDSDQTLTLAGKGTTPSVKRVGGYKGALFVVNGGAILTLENIIIDGNKSYDEPANALVRLFESSASEALNQGPTLIINTGAILKNNINWAIFSYAKHAQVTINGGELTNNARSAKVKNDTLASVIQQSGGNLTMTGGSIHDNFGGIDFSDIVNINLPPVPGEQAIFNMSGGEISRNSKQIPGRGSAVHIKNAIFNMSGGKISDNTVVEDTSGTYKESAGISLSGIKPVMNMTGGIISGNKAPGGHGGGIASGNAKLNLTGGEISGNEAGAGGAIYCAGVDKLDPIDITINGVKIKNNKAIQYGVDEGGFGGALYILTTGVYRINGGEISGNSADVGGGAIYMSGWRTTTMRRLEITGGSISANTSDEGAAICTTNATNENVEIVMSGGVINKNRSSFQGGAIFLRDKSVLDISGGEIIDNYAMSQGGAISEEPGSKIKISGGKISGNKVHATLGLAPGIYAESATIELSGSPIIEDEVRLSQTSTSGTADALIKIPSKLTVSKPIPVSGNPNLDDHVLVVYAAGLTPDLKQFVPADVAWKLMKNNAMNALYLVHLNEFTIASSSAGVGGTISPLGDTKVYEGTNLTYTITPNPGYQIKDVLVDGVSVGALSSYEFVNITKNNTIEAQFELIPVMHAVNVINKGNGKVDPEGITNVKDKDNLSIKITPNQGYLVDKVLVDGAEVKLMGDVLLLNNISKNQVVEISFKPMTYKITITNNGHGSVNPEGIVNVLYDQNLTINIKADEGYLIDTIMLDGTPIELPSIMRRNIQLRELQELSEYSHTMFNIMDHHNIEVTFKQKPIVVDSFNITISHGNNGTINPSGVLTVKKDSNLNLLIQPDKGYELDKFMLDGKEVPISGLSYLLEKISGNHEIKVTFKAVINKPDEKPVTPITPIKPETPSTGDQSGVVSFMFLMSGAFLVLLRRNKVKNNCN
ncbi:MAG: hypothetical protein RR741_02505 [Erysipelotrichaceae bacterium]